MATKRVAVKKKPGRKKIQFNLKQIEALGSIMATQEEMAAIMGCSADTIQDRVRTDPAFSGALEKGRATGKISVRRKQKNVALSGNATMLIWLGKQWLEQRDRTDVFTTHQLSGFREEFAEAGRALVEGVNAGMNPDEVLARFISEVNNIGEHDGQPGTTRVN